MSQFGKMNVSHKKKKYYKKTVNLEKMGMYDSVWVQYPNCETENEFQTKSGECFLYHYTLENCPDDVMVDVNRHSPCHCDCGAFYQVDIIERKAVLIAVE